MPKYFENPAASCTISISSPGGDVSLVLSLPEDWKNISGLNSSVRHLLMYSSHTDCTPGKQRSGKALQAWK